MWKEKYVFQKECLRIKILNLLEIIKEKCYFSCKNVWIAKLN